MSGKSAHIDAYIERSSPPFRSLCLKLRDLIHEACPDIKETIKWGFPHFEYEGIVCSFATFKEHMSFGFWKGDILDDPQGLLAGVGKTQMGAMRIETPDDLPPDDVLVTLIKQAVRLNVEGIKVPQPRSSPPGDLQIPAYLLEALAAHPAAKATFEGFSYSNKKEYVEWIASAKREQTRRQRLETALEWMAEGKPRNWKYMK